eukprot:TRINITY_DN8351_c0_g1_i2.p1 TRINITY_DN8351_c0_g1~~TRINITY_DN8351_c0_g1_i2.p1  ORF type:complete len:368 (+),score=63.26 TRINITY_DN8351_c0_g1_i2:1026-2129(+)
MSGATEPEQLSPEEEQKLEIEHFRHVAFCFEFYQQHALSRVIRARNAFRQLPKPHQTRVSTFVNKLKTISQKAIRTNNELVKSILANLPPFTESDEPVEAKAPTEFDMDKVYTTIKQFYRDWSAEGQEERAASYGKVIQCVEDLYQDVKKDERGSISILCPGAGLGRLAWDFAHRGFSSQGNEWSAYMLFASNFVLNELGGKPESVTVYPFAHMYCNNLSAKEQTHSVQIPDVDPSHIPPTAQFSMSAGDFLQAYTDEAAFDVVASVFFLDTARNIIAFIERIYHILKPGGHLINFGPLLYHFEDNMEAPSVELTWQELREVLITTGFILKAEETGLPSTYIAHPDSMLTSVYKCVYFVCQKPGADS